MAGLRGSKFKRDRQSPFIVADYDLVMAEPRQQLERIARGLKIPLNDASKAGSSSSPATFSIPNLRHSFFNVSDFELDPESAPLTREAYLWLRRLATDRTATDSPDSGQRGNAAARPFRG